MSAKITYKDKDGNYGRLDTSRLTGKDGNEIKNVVNATVDRVESLESKLDAEPIDSSKSYSEGEIVYAEGASWRVAAGGADAGDLPSTHPDKFVSFQEGVTSIANKEAAYALTGVAAGTVYKTEDTGQVMERRSTLDIETSFNISDAGSPDDGIGGLDGRYQWDDANNRFQFMGSNGAMYRIRHNGTAWILEWNEGMTVFTSPASASTVHPADVTGAWTAGIGTGTIDGDDVTANRLYNWKLDGVIQVFDNDEKQLLTNLPDGQQVEIVGEGRRIEQLPPSPLPDIKRGFIVSSEGNPRSSTSDGGRAVSGAFFWHEVDSQFVRDEDGTYYSAYVVHDGSRWQIGYQMGYFFQSATCASTVHPADATGWTAYDAGLGIGQGTIANDGLVKTRACEVYDSPQYNTSGSTPWRTIKNTVELTWHDDWDSGDQTINGITAPEGTATNVGWVAVGELIQGTNISTDNYTWTTTEINGSQPNIQVFPKMVLLDNAGILIPDAFPSGATITVKSS